MKEEKTTNFRNGILILTNSTENSYISSIYTRVRQLLQLTLVTVN